MKKRLTTLMATMILLICGIGSAESPSVESEDIMSYIPQVNVGGAVYNLKDNEAREQISDLNRAVASIKESTEKREFNIVPFYPDNHTGTIWLKGYVNYDGQIITSGSYRTTSFYIPETVVSIVSNNPYVMNIYAYEKDGTYSNRILEVTSFSAFQHSIYNYRICIQQNPAVSLDNVEWQPYIVFNAMPTCWKSIDKNTASIESIIKYGEGSIPVENDDFTVGSINASGEDITVRYSYRSLAYLKNTIIGIRAKAGCAFGLYVYDINNNFLSRTLDLTETKLNHDDHKYRIIFYHFPLDSSDDVRSTIPDEYISFFTEGINIQTENAKYSVNNGEILVMLDKVQLSIKRITDQAINVDTWRLHAGYLTNKGVIVGTLWYNSDVEGAIKISGEDDFIGGFHGDEIMTSVVILADGKPIDLTEEISGKQFNEIMICVESNVYHCNTSTLAGQIAFQRTKTIKITKSGYTISNRYIAQANIQIERGALAMVSALKTDSLGQPMITHIGCNSDIKLYACPSNSGSDPMPHSQPNKAMTSASLYLTGAVLTLSMIYGQENPGYNPYFNNMTSQDRMKIYFDQYNNQSVQSGNVLQDEFSVEII